METDREQDQILVQQVRRGDTEAFGLLVRKYRRRMLRMAARIAGNRAEAEDIAQETFIRAYRGLAHFRGDAAFQTWLYQIALNTARSRLGRQRCCTHSGLEALAEAETPEAALHGKQVLAGMSSVLDSLPPSWRTAITLRELDGLTYLQIAAAMQCPLGTVRSRLARARGALRDGMSRPRQAT
jgi:RNA polymerase sigma-70 factor (ECF subfamily)